jgi:hypothetical protein
MSKNQELPQQLRLITNYLHLDCCKFEDEEAVQVLVDNIRA